MKFLNIMGSVTDLDRVAETYLSKYEIQLEYTIKELSNEKGLSTFTDPNPYAPILKRAEGFVKITGLSPLSDSEDLTINLTKDVTTSLTTSLTKEEALETIEYATSYFEKTSLSLNEKIKKRDEIRNAITLLEPFAGLDFEIETIADFEFIRYQFGKIPITSFLQFEAFLYQDSDIIFIESMRDGDYIWGVYFSADLNIDKVDSIFSSLHFEKIDLPFEVNGEPLHGKIEEILPKLRLNLQDTENYISEKINTMMDEADNDEHIPLGKSRIVDAYKKLKILDKCFDIRKYAAKTDNDFYIFVGWITYKDAEKLIAELSNDDKVFLISEEENDSILSKPPIKLKNNPLVRPFEFFVSMYGLPAYNEIDPTPFVAVTYTLLFGIMFGDLGQGLVLALLGLFLSVKKKSQLGKIMIAIGMSSAFFGIFYGSVFGFEFSGLWGHSPSEPDSINTILIYAIILGIFLNVISMSISILNAIRVKRLKEVLCEPNGVAGIVSYTAIIVAALLIMLGYNIIAITVAILFVAYPFVLIAIREPLKVMRENKKKNKNKRKLIKGSVPLFAFETLIEVFEIILSYFTSTVSFVRVGAFALSHACMMGVVMMLSRTAANTHNIVIIILGNLLVMGLEGLIVGIQVLRLEFYEMFSRFYNGTGRAFKPYGKQ